MPSDSTVLHTACGKSTLDCTCPPIRWEDGQRTGGCECPPAPLCPGGCSPETCATAFEFLCDSLRLINARLRKIEGKLNAAP